VLVKLLLDQDISLGICLDNSELFYQLIKYQDVELVSYFIDTNLVDIDKTSWIWTSILFGNKSMYSQLIQYTRKKFFVSTINFFINFSNHYQGKYICDIFDDDTNFYRL